MPDPDPQSQTTTPGQALAGTPPPQQAPPPPPQVQGDMPLNSRLAPGQPPSGLPQDRAGREQFNNQQGPPQQLTPQQKAQAAEVAHHSALGKVASVLLGKEVQYRVDPNTGAVVPVKVQRSPGSFMQSLVAGAILGAAAGFQHPQGGFLGGAAAGGAAVIQDERAWDEQARARALESFKNAQTIQQNQREKQAAADEHMVHQATAAHLTAETVAFHHLQDSHDQEALDAKNKAAKIYLQTFEAAGAKPASIPVNGKVPANGAYNASELSAALTKDPKILFGAPGTVRHFVDVNNASDVEYVEGKGWVNASGEPANMTKNTLVKVFDVPEDMFKKQLHHTGSEVNAIVGFPLVPEDQLDHDFSGTLDRWTNLYTTNLKNLNQKAQADQREGAAAKAKAQANNAGKPKQGTPGEFDRAIVARDAAIAKATAAYNDPANLRLYRKADELARVKAEAQATYEARVKQLKGAKGGQGFNVTDPKGVVHTFTDQKSADAFKKAVGIQ
jgi:hypothetical protein